MNPEEIINIKNNINNLKASIDDITQAISALKIDKQMVLKSNNPIPPGIACRITFDSNGLVLKGEDLRSEDIPDIPIGKVVGLTKALESKNEELMLLSTNKESDVDINKIEAGTGIKINYDEYGRVLSSSNILLESDIPDLTIEKIKGLGDKLSFIESQINNESNNTVVEISTVTAGTFPKITFDSSGKVLNGSKLSVDDIPISLINRINTVESRISSLASQQTVDALVKDIKGKVKSKGDISPGIYTKVTVDSQGLITSGDKITISDLPEIQIKDVINLETILRKKADYSDFVELTNTVSSIMSNGKSNEIIKLQNQMSTKASNEDLKKIDNKLTNTQMLLDKLVDKLPSEYIVEQLDQIQLVLSNLTSRIVSLEQKVKMDDSFDKEED